MATKLSRKIKLKCIVLFIILLFIKSVLAGVTYPEQLSLAPGEKSEFLFAVDAATSEIPIKCKIEFNEQTPLKINFKKTEITLQPGTREFITGEVKVPRKTNSGNYKETFCVSCDPLVDIEGTTTRPRYCDIPIRVEIKAHEESPQKTTKILASIFISINIILLIISLILFIKRRKMSLNLFKFHNYSKKVFKK